MKLSELIKQLQAAHAEYGDIEACVMEPDEHFPVPELSIEHYMETEFYACPDEHILISC